MTVSSTTNKVSYSGNGSTTVFAYTFKIFADGDLDVYIRSSTGTETLKTLTTDYTVSNAGNDAGGNVTFGTAPASGETVVIQRVLGLTQGTDYVENDPFPAESHEEALDRLTFITQQMQEEIDRSIKASVTNTISSTEFTIAAADRANKIFAFDGSGDLSVTQELGTYQGDWAASTTYAARDIVKDTSTNNIFLANTAHTSSGSQPLTTNTDSAKWDLLVDAASATTAQTAAAASAAAASTSESNAAASESAASGYATTASGHATTASTQAGIATTKASEASTSAASAASSVVDFRDTYYGSHANDSAAETYQTGTNGGTVDSGDLYFNTTSLTLKIYNGSTWQDAALTAASFLTVANNLSDLNSAATARTNLGLVIGTDVQAYDAGLAYLDGLNFTDESTFKAAVNLEIGTDVQAYDADTLKADTADTLTASFRGTVTTDNDLSFDMNVTNNFKCTPTATGALTFTNITAGQSGNIWLDNSAGVVISAASSTYIASADLTTINTAGVYFLSYYSDGTNVMVSATPAVTSAGA